MNALVLCAQPADEAQRNPLFNSPVGLAFTPHDSGRPNGVVIHYLLITAPLARQVSMSVQKPAGYLIEYDTRLATIRFTREDQSGWLTLRLINTGSGTAMLDKEITQQWLMRQHAKTQLLKAAPAKVGSHNGFVYDLLWPTTGGINLHQRAIYAPVTGGILELTANATPDNFAKLEQDFAGLAFAFRLCPNGRNDLQPPPSDNN